MATIQGVTRPRLFTAPLEPNSRGLPKHTRGRAFIRWCRDFGEPLWAWEEELALRGLETVGPDGPYRFRILIVLVARQNGKTTFLRLLALWALFDVGVRLVVAAAQDRSRAFEVWEHALEGIKGSEAYQDRIEREWRRTNDEYFRVRDAEGKPAGYYRIKAATRGSGRGPSADLVPFDELREQTDWLGWAALSKTTMARENGQIWAFSNAGDRKSVVLRHLRAVALAGTDPAIGLMEWSATEGCALDDWREIAHANPTLNRPGGIPAAAIRTALVSDPPEIFRTEVLCQEVDALDHAVDADAWLTSGDPVLDQRRTDWVACLDVAPDSEHVTLALAAVLPDGRVRAEVAAGWDSQAGVPATERARRELAGVLAEVRPRKITWFPAGPAKALGGVIRAFASDRKDYVVEIKGGMVSEACMGFADLVSARLVAHAADPLLTAHVTGAQRLPEGDGWRFVRSGAAHCDAAYAAAGAVHVARMLPAPVGKPRLIIAE
jgi:hypothetical protein